MHTLERRKYKDCEFKVTLAYISSFRPVWLYIEILSQKTDGGGEEEQQLVTIIL